MKLQRIHYYVRKTKWQTSETNPALFTVQKIKSSRFVVQEHPVPTNLPQSRARRAATTPIQLQNEIQKIKKFEKSHSDTSRAR